MQNRYEKFYKINWAKAYGFWHKIITRGEQQVIILRETISNINKEKINILDLGCGDGSEIQEAISGLQHKSIQIVANDTSKEALNEYLKFNSSNVAETIQDRLENLPNKLNKKFDLILFSHSLYAVKLQGLFTEYLKLLSDKGTMLIFLDSKQNGIKKIQRKFWEQVHNVPFDENTAEDIIKKLLNAKIKYELTKFLSFIDLEKLEKIGKDGVAQLIIPFAFRTRDIKPEIINIIVSYIKTLEQDKKIDNETFAIIIRK